MCHYVKILSLRELSLIMNSLLLRYEMRSALKPWACGERISRLRRKDVLVENLFLFFMP